MKIIQNKIISFLLIICSIFVLTGCGGASKNNNQNNENQILKLNITQSKCMQILGDGDVTVTLSLEN